MLQWFVPPIAIPFFAVALIGAIAVYNALA
jgi:hypothetical protein